MTVAFGMIGSGGMGRVHAEAIADGAQGTRLVAVAGGTGAMSLADEYGVPADASVEALLARQDINAVVIATPHTSHLPLVRAAVAAGKHVFLEKQMGLDVAECSSSSGPPTLRSGAREPTTQDEPDDTGDVRYVGARHRSCAEGAIASAAAAPYRGVRRDNSILLWAERTSRLAEPAQLSQHSSALGPGD